MLLDVCPNYISLCYTSTGKTLLNQQNPTQTITDFDWRLLKVFTQGNAIAPSKIKIKNVKAAERNKWIDTAIEKNLLTIAEKTITEVCLTEVGKEFLATEYMPNGGNILISSQMLENYLRFVRKYWKNKVNSSEGNNQPNLQISEAKEHLIKPNDQEILQTIIALDKELNTDNYLPIFHLREKFQPPLTREELDQVLYHLQRQDKLSMSSLVMSSKYTPEQYRAGIPQNSVGPLFFLIVNEP